MKFWYDVRTCLATAKDVIRRFAGLIKVARQQSGNNDVCKNMALNPKETSFADRKLSRRSRVRSYASSSWHYLSQVLAVIGLAGILDDLKTWGKLWVWVIETTAAWSPSAAAVIETAVSTVHAISTVWRQLLHPVIEVLVFSWLPLPDSALLKDALLIAFFIAVGRAKADEFWFRESPKAQQRIDEIAKKYSTEKLDHWAHSRYYIAQYMKIRAADPDFLDPHELQSVRSIDRTFGANAVEFATDVLTDPEFEKILAAQHKAIAVSDRQKLIVLLSAVLVGSFLLFDFIYFLRPCKC